MADYSHHQNRRAARATHESGGLGWTLTALAAVLLAAVAWVWSRPQSAGSVLPQPVGQSASVMTPGAPLVPPPARTSSPAPSDAVAAAGDTRAQHP